MGENEKKDNEIGESLGELVLNQWRGWRGRCRRMGLNRRKKEDRAEWREAEKCLGI